MTPPDALTARPRPPREHLGDSAPIAAPTDNAHLRTQVMTIAPVAVENLPSRPAARLDDGLGDDAPALKPGDRVLGFTILEPIGEGAFARVFLAKQATIGNRFVVLKVAVRGNPEADRLGGLQHPNVVPIHSVHRAGPHFLICMPYLGRRTLADRITFRFGSPSSAVDHPTPLPFPIQSPAGSPPPGEYAPAASRAGMQWALKMLSGLAAGLDHAHRHGILHLDIKPANILLADAGAPMLLDFNLAHDTNRTRVLSGGTLPYMAPEQIADLISGGQEGLDERTDLYSLGVVAYELMTGCHPFPAEAVTHSTLPHFLKAHSAAVPRLRDKNAAVTPAVEAIVHKLLAHDRAARYQTALELKTDLDRQLADLPLLSAPDCSLWERFGKWRRRNPWVPIRLAAAVGIGLVAGIGVDQAHRQRAAREAAAVTQAIGIQHRMASLRMELALPGDPVARARGRDAANDILAQFNVTADRTWRDRSAFARLPDPLKPGVAADLGELLLLIAHSHWLDAQTAPWRSRPAHVTEAIRFNTLAAGCFDAGAAPPFLALQRTALTGEAATPNEARHPRDHYLNAVHLIGEGKLRQAVPSLEKAVAGEPGHAAAHFALAYCRHRLGEYTRALERYDTAHALLPSDPRPAFQRGLVYGLQQQHAPAEQEFDLAVLFDPGHGEAYLNRAVARMNLDQPKLREAERDLTAALERRVPALQVLFLRAQVRTQLGDRVGAEQDRLAAQEYEPRSETDFLARGRSRLPADPLGALADFEAAAGFNPASLPALQSQAEVLSDYLGENTRSLAVATQAVALSHDSAPARVQLAILLARFGKREDAHQEAETARQFSDDAVITYQTATVYARTSRNHEADADRALTLLRQAVRDGFRDADALDANPDLDPIRSSPDYAALRDGLKESVRSPRDGGAQ